MKLEPPICAVCKRQVDRFEMEHDKMRGVVVAHSWCHEQYEHHELQQEVIEDGQLVGLGLAFYERTLPEDVP